MNFSKLGLTDALARVCESLGYTEPTPIQRRAIPFILSGSDLIGCAETGTGKTAAFLLPIIQRITERQLPGARVLVLDEADRMLDMGFWPSIRRILAELPVKRQTLLFSATMSPAIEEIARKTMRSPELIEVSPRGRAAATVEQTVYPVAIESKTALLLDLLEREKERFERVLVFTRTRRGAERLSHILRAREHKVNRIHADRTQPQREAALREFGEGRTHVLVATDIAARGIDVDSISHVINYDVPTAPEDYVHRIGRTGRAGKVGRAITLVTPADELSMRGIERLTGQQLERICLPAFGGVATMGGSLNRASAPQKQMGRGSGRRSF